jgi:hypothetical protein
VVAGSHVGRTGGVIHYEFGTTNTQNQKFERTGALGDVACEKGFCRISPGIAGTGVFWSFITTAWRTVKEPIDTLMLWFECEGRLDSLVAHDLLSQT